MHGAVISIVDAAIDLRINPPQVRLNPEIALLLINLLQLWAH